MLEFSSQFFRTTTGIPSGPDAFEESRFVTTFLTILGVTEILCNFTLSDAEDNTSGLLNRGSIAELALLVTLLGIRQKSQEPSFWEMRDSFVLLPYTSLTAVRTLLQ